MMNSKNTPNKNRILLVLIVLLAGGLRLYGLNWDESHHLHPDERFVVMTALETRWPASFSDYLHPEISPLSPYNTPDSTSYIYGTFPLFLTKGLATILGYHAYGRIHLVGRFLSALFDLGSLLLVYLIAARLFSKRTGVLSAALYGVAVMHIQQSHFFTTDNFLVFWILLTFLLLIMLLESEGSRAFVLSCLAGASYGCALGSKASAVLLVTIIFFVFGMSCAQLRGKTSLLKNVLVLSGKIIVFVLSSYFMFRFVQPYAFASSSWFDLTPQQDFWRALDYQRRALAGEVMFPPQWQWVNTAPILFPLKNILLWGLGLPLGIASIAGAGLFLGKQLKAIVYDRKEGMVQVIATPALLAIAWILVSFAYGGVGFVKSMRYFLPVTPFVIIFAAHAWEKIPCRIRFLSPVSGLLLFCLTLIWALAYVNIYSHETTRVAASKWIYNTIPQLSVLANEEWDDRLPLPLSADLLAGEQAGDKHFESFLVHVYNPDSAEKAGNLCRDLGRADYIILSSPRAWGSIGRLPDHYPVMTRYYQLLDRGDLGFEMVKECTSYPHLLGWEINDSSAEESFWVYDHPPVRIHKKTRDFSRDDCQKLLLHETNVIKK